MPYKVLEADAHMHKYLVTDNGGVINRGSGIRIIPDQRPLHSKLTVDVLPRHGDYSLGGRQCLGDGGSTGNKSLFQKHSISGTG